MSKNTPRLPDLHDEVDWDSDHAGVLAGRMHYRDSDIGLKFDLDEDPECHIHVQDDGDILVTLIDNAEATRDVSMWLDSDEARLIAKQLQFAAEHSDSKEGGADVRL